MISVFPIANQRLQSALQHSYYIKLSIKWGQLYIPVFRRFKEFSYLPDDTSMGQLAASSTEVHIGSPEHGGCLGGDVHLPTLAKCCSTLRRTQVSGFCHYLYSSFIQLALRKQDSTDVQVFIEQFSYDKQIAISIFGLISQHRMFVNVNLQGRCSLKTLYGIVGEHQTYK